MQLKSPPGLETHLHHLKLEAVWNALRSSLDAAVVFDVFSGSGAIGIDAVSLGARGPIL